MRAGVRPTDAPASASRGLAVNVSLFGLKSILTGPYGRTAFVFHAGRRYSRDENGAWRDEAGRQADVSTCFALADEEKKAASGGGEPHPVAA